MASSILFAAQPKAKRWRCLPYDRKVVPKFRIDMVNWIERNRKRPGTRKSSHSENDKVGRVHCAYTRGRHADAMMVRRVFWLVGTEENVNSNVLVHYRLEEPLQRRCVKHQRG